MFYNFLKAIHYLNRYFIPICAIFATSASDKPSPRGGAARSRAYSATRLVLKGTASSVCRCKGQDAEAKDERRPSAGDVQQVKQSRAYAYRYSVVVLKVVTDVMSVERADGFASVGWK